MLLTVTADLEDGALFTEAVLLTRTSIRVRLGKAVTAVLSVVNYDSNVQLVSHRTLLMALLR